MASAVDETSSVQIVGDGVLETYELQSNLDSCHDVVADANDSQRQSKTSCLCCRSLLLKYNIVLEHPTRYVQE